MRYLIFLAPILCGFSTVRVGTTTTSAKWASNAVTYYVDSSGVASMPDASDTAAAYQAMAAWNTVACSSFEFVDGGVTTGDPGNTIRFVHSSGSWAGDAGVVAYTARFISGGTTITSGDIFVNDFSFTWSRSGDRAAYDLQSVLTHELGHALGLQHSADPTTTMYWRGTKGSTFFRTLSPDDVAGVCHLYPAATVPCDGNEDCPMLDSPGGTDLTTVCSGGACVGGQRGYGEDCFDSTGCLGGTTCARFDGAASSSTTAPGLCTQATCPCPNGDPCDDGTCVPRGASCDVAACDAVSSNHHCIVGVDGRFACIEFCLEDSHCGAPPAFCYDPAGVDDAGRCRTPGPGAIGTPCEAPSDCATLICGVGLDGVARCAAPDEVVDPPDPPSDTGGGPDGGDPAGGDSAGDPVGDSGAGGDNESPDPSDPGNSVDGGCAASTPSFALVMGAIVVALFAVQRTRVVRRIS